MAIDLFAPTGRNGLNPSIADRIDASGDCWIWLGAPSDSGYGRVTIKGKLKRVHRVIWETLVGPIAKNLEIDHLCRVRNCVNPDHLEPVTRATNLARGRSNKPRPFCRRGHEYTPANTYQRKNRERQCRACQRINEKKRSVSRVK